MFVLLKKNVILPFPCREENVSWIYVKVSLNLYKRFISLIIFHHHATKMYLIVKQQSAI